MDRKNSRGSVKAMISIRPFNESDNQSMLEIEKLCPQGDENCAMGVDKKDIIARYKMYENWNVLVAEEDGKIAGWIGLTAKPINGREEKYAYITEVMVHPAFRQAGIATKLVAEAEKSALEMKASYTYCYIYEPNKVSKSLFGKLGYSKVRDVKLPAIPTYRKSDVSAKYSMKPVDKEDIGDAVDLINEYNSSFIHFLPFTAQTFESRLKEIPAYGADNFWTVRDENNRIVACAGLWDSSKLADIYYAREPLQIKIMKSVLGALSHFTKVPKIPEKGEYLKNLYVADFAFEKRQPDAMLELLKHLNNVSIDMNKDYMINTIDPEDDFFSIMKKLKPQVDPWTVFAKPLKGDLPTFSPLYVDIRDMIL